MNMSSDIYARVQNVKDILRQMDKEDIINILYPIIEKCNSNPDKSAEHYILKSLGAIKLENGKWRLPK